MREIKGLTTRTRIALTALVVLVLTGVAWRVHLANLPTPSYPSSWIYQDCTDHDFYSVTWSRSNGTEINGTFEATGNTYIDQITNAWSCLHGTLDGSLNGSSVNFTVYWSDGSGSTAWYGSISQTSMAVGSPTPQAVRDYNFTPGPRSTFDKLAESCVPG